MRLLQIATITNGESSVFTNYKLPTHYERIKTAKKSESSSMEIYCYTRNDVTCLLDQMKRHTHKFKKVILQYAVIYMCQIDGCDKIKFPKSKSEQKIVEL